MLLVCEYGGGSEPGMRVDTAPARPVHRDAYTGDYQLSTILVNLRVTCAYLGQTDAASHLGPLPVVGAIVSICSLNLMIGGVRRKNKSPSSSSKTVDAGVSVVY